MLETLFSPPSKGEGPGGWTQGGQNYVRNCTDSRDIVNLTLFFDFSCAQFCNIFYVHFQWSGHGLWMTLM